MSRLLSLLKSAITRLRGCAPVAILVRVVKTPAPLFVSTVMPPPFQFAVTKWRLVLLASRAPAATNWGLAGVPTVLVKPMVPSEFVEGVRLREVARPPWVLVRVSRMKPGRLATVKFRTNGAVMGLLARSMRLVLAVKRYLPV